MIVLLTSIILGNTEYVQPPQYFETMKECRSAAAAYPPPKAQLSWVVRCVEVNITTLEKTK